jgi:hypothetical protein
MLLPVQRLFDADRVRELPHGLTSPAAARRELCGGCWCYSTAVSIPEPPSYLGRFHICFKLPLTLLQVARGTCRK